LKNAPEAYIKRHNDAVKKLVLNVKASETNLTYLFPFLNRIFFSDVLNKNITIEWSFNCIGMAAKVRLFFITNF
jgi:hypothetical protein